MTVAMLIVGGLILLILGGDFLVKGASQIASILRISPMIIGLTVVAFGTSSPELAVSLAAALKGNADIAVANVVGSSIFNVLFILGISACLFPLIIHSAMIRREVPIMVASSILLWIMAWGGTISSLEGLFLFAGVFIYTAWLIRSARKEQKTKSELNRESKELFEPIRKQKPKLPRSIFFVAAGLAMIMFGADWLVKGAIEIALRLGVSEVVIGLTIVAAGTSLPEVVASVMATIRGERDIAVANAIGSNIYNILAIAGLSSLITPGGLTVSQQLLRFDIPVMVVAASLCLPFFYSRKTLSRLEGVFFLCFYVAYTCYVLMKATNVV